jgi:hypothetical protein
MIQEPKIKDFGFEPDEVMKEVWRIKDEMAAEYNGDIDRFFRDLRAMEERRRANSVPEKKAS